MKKVIIAIAFLLALTASAGQDAQTPQERVSVASGNAEHHPEGAAQEHQTAHHDAHGQQEASDRRAAALGGKLLPPQGHDKGAQNQPDDLRPEILHRGCPVQPQGPRRIPQETGDAEAHVGRVSEFDKDRRDDADQQSRSAQDGGFFLCTHALSSDSVCFFERILRCGQIMPIFLFHYTALGWKFKLFLSKM